MKKKLTAQSALVKLRVLLALVVASIYIALFARSEPEALDHSRTRVGERLEQANTKSLSPADSVYEAWVARYNGPGNNYDQARAIGLDNSGNVYVGGFSYGGATAADYATIKYNAGGHQEWVARYNGLGNGDDYLLALAVDASGNVYVTGFSVIDTDTHFDCLTIKYDSAGQEQWIARYTAPSGYAAGDAIALDGAGNVYVAAEGAIPSDVNTRFCVTVKYNSAGEQQWIREYDGGMNSNRPTAIAVDGAANVYVTGNILSCPTFEYLTLKYDSAGQEQWVARYQGPGSGGGSANAIAVDPSGNVYVTGDSYTSGVSSSTVKYNSTGQQQWVARNEQAYYEAHALTIDSASNVYVTGEVRDDPESYPDYGTIKYNSAGQPQWLARYSAPSGNSYDSANAIALDGAGNVYVTGRSAGTGVYRYPDYATIKYNSIGQQQWIARYDGAGNTDDEPIAIAVDKLGDVYVTGTSGSDFATVKYGQGAPPTPSIAPTGTPTPTSTATPTPTTSITPGSPTPTPPEPHTPTPAPTATPTPVKVCGQYVTSTDTGTIAPGTTDIGNHCDNCLTLVSFPFPVQFYGSLISQAYVNSNGSLQFIGGMTRFGTSCPLPDRCLDAGILVYQDDLRTDGPGDGVFTSVSGTAPNRVFNIEWRATYFGRSGSANFEVRFYENQTFFEMIYGVSNENGALASSGVQQGTLVSRYAGPPTTFSCGTPTLTNGLKVTYRFQLCTTRPRPTPHARP